MIEEIQEGEIRSVGVRCIAGVSEAGGIFEVKPVRRHIGVLLPYPLCLPGIQFPGSQDGVVELKQLSQIVDAFVDQQGWYGEASSRPQTARNLAISVCLEAAELLECFQWGDDSEADAVSNELADVLIYCLQLANQLEIDPEVALLRKIDWNGQRIWQSDRKGG